jgi:hypothetical protein
MNNMPLPAVPVVGGASGGDGRARLHKGAEMISFVFPQYKIIMIMGIAEIALGILLGLGVLRGRGTSNAFGRLFGGGILVVMGLLFLNVRNTGEIVIDEGSIYLKVPFQRDKVIRTGDIASVIEVDFAADRAYRPARKVSGGNFRDVRTGWFKLASGTKAFLCIRGTRGLYIETSLGFPALVGTADFEAFEAAFAEHVYAPRRGED